MTTYDVFNGDADGICALVQLRCHEPKESTLVTGVKRDIALLERVDATSGDQVTALDISMDKNADALQRLLGRGADVFYVDHHFPGSIPSHPNLRAIINEASDTCTSILVNTFLKGKYCAWALVGAFGDNLKKSAHALAKSLHCSEQEVDALERLGVCINYNAYGSDISDLYYAPDVLFQKLSRYTDPLQFIEDDKETFQRLETGYHEDMARAASIQPERVSAVSAVYILPDEPWARRVSGIFSNALANDHPDRAHAVLTAKPDGSFLVSVRAPLNRKTGAVDVCKQFPTGGGRAAAAGINALPSESVPVFCQTLDAYYGGQ